MIKRNLQILMTAVAVGALCSAIALSGAQAQSLQDPQKQREIAPGMNPGTGQINRGEAVQPPASAPPGKMDQSGQGADVTNKAPPSDTHAATNQPIATPEQARAALMVPDSPDAAIGQIALPPTGNAQQAKSATGDAPAENAKSQQSENNAQSGDGSNKETSGNAAREEAAKQASHETSPNKPIGSTTQTLPAKFSDRNGILDRVPTMAWPLRLNDQQRRQVFEVVMNDKNDAAEIGKLKASDQLPAQIAMNGMHPLPQDLAADPVFNNIQAVKGKDAVLLVNPATRIVVDVIAN